MIYHGQVEATVRRRGGPNPLQLKMEGDELWVGGERPIKLRDSWFSPRNAFRCSVACFLPEVELLDGRWAYKVTDVSQTPNAGKSERSSETVGGISFIVERETAQTTN